MTKGRFILALLCLFTMVFLSGCWGAKEPDELGFILYTGVDKVEGNLLEVTFGIAVPQAGGAEGKGGKSERELEIVSVNAASFYGAVQLANAFVSRDLTFLHNRALIFSEEVAREGLEGYVNTMIRSRELRRNTFVLVANGKAKEFIASNQAILETYPYRQMEFFLEGKKFVGFIPHSNLNMFYKALKSPGEEAITALCGVNDGKGRGIITDKEGKIIQEIAYLPGEIPRQGGNKIDIIGTAVFRGDKLMGYLNGNETRYYQMVKGDFQSAMITLPDPENKESLLVIVLKVELGRPPTIKVDVKGEKPRIQIDLLLEGEIISTQSSTNYESGVEKAELEQYAGSIINNEILAVIQKTQQEYQSDIFGFGDHTRSFFWTWSAWEQYNWSEKYPQAEVEAKTTVKIRRTGLKIRTSPLPEVKGGEGP